MDELIHFDVTEQHIQTGVRALATDCPIAKSLNETLGTKYDAHAWREYLTFYVNSMPVRFPVPPPMLDWMDRFDVGLEVNPCSFDINPETRTVENFIESA